MKNIEEIREKLGPDYRVEEKDGVITVCDVWDGVEFARCVRSDDAYFSKGSVYRIQRVERGRLHLHYDDEGRLNSRVKEFFTPASEDEYVEQLKKEAKERFGEIVRGDFFDCSKIGLGSHKVQFYQLPDCEYYYYKEDDSFQLGGFRLYQKGKWAKKLKPRVSVEIEDWKTTTNAEFKSFDFRVEMRVESSHPFDPNESAVYIAKCLEEYLNKS